MRRDITELHCRRMLRGCGDMRQARIQPFSASPVWQQRALPPKFFIDQFGSASEKLTRLGRDPVDELGGQANWHQATGSRILLLAGADTRDIRAADYEQLFPGAGGELSTSSHQRQTGVYGEALYTPENWTVSGSARVDHFSNFDAKQYQQPGAFTALPTLDETVLDPRLGVTRRLGRR